MKWKLLLAALLVAPWGHAETVIREQNGDRLISDSLVQDLSCKRLSTGAIYQSIRDDAFDYHRHIPLDNWSFYSGALKLGACWALSSTQRMFFYLSRFDDSTRVNKDDLRDDVLDMISGSQFKPVIGTPHPHAMEYSTPASDYRVIPIAERNLVQTVIGGLMSDLVKGYTQTIGVSVINRNFKEEVESCQNKHFFRKQNVDLISGGGERPASVNKSTAELLKINLSGKRLTLIVMRYSKTNQHAVLAKSFKTEANGDMTITVYDSNTPWVEHHVIYHKATQQYTAPEVWSILGVSNPNKNLGVFVVDEQERTTYENAMLNYYRAQCQGK